LIYETRRDRLATRATFAKRQPAHTAVCAGLVSGSLAIGGLGYHGFISLPWLEALLNALMMMGDMGPVDALHTTAGKLFAPAYAPYWGLVLLVAAGVLFAPLPHRRLHRFHLTTEHDSR